MKVKSNAQKLKQTNKQSNNKKGTHNAAYECMKNFVPRNKVQKGTKPHAKGSLVASTQTSRKCVQQTKHIEAKELNTNGFKNENKVNYLYTHTHGGVMNMP